MRRLWATRLGAIILAGAVGLLSSANAQIDTVSVQINKKFFDLAGSINPTPNPNEPFILRFQLFNDTPAAVIVPVAPGSVALGFPITDQFTDTGFAGGPRVNTGLVTTTNPPRFRVIANPTPGATGVSNCGAIAPAVGSTFITNASVVSTNAAGTSVTLQNLTIPASNGDRGTCFVEVEVRSAILGSNPNILPGRSSPPVATDPQPVLDLPKPGGGRYQNENIQENVVIPTVDAPSINKGFGTVGSGSAAVGNNLTENTSTNVALTVRVRNNDTAQNINNVVISDQLPTPLIFANTTRTFSSGCLAVGAATPDTVFTPVGTPNNVQITVPRIAPNSFCDVSFTVVGTSSGVFTNTIPANAVTTREGVTNASGVSRSLTYQSLDSAKSFDAPTTLTRVSTSNSQTIATVMRLTVTNRLTTPVSSVNVTDYFTVGGAPTGTPLDLELTGAAVTVTPPSCGGTSQGATNIPNAAPAFAAVAAGQRGIQVTGLTLAASASCTILVPVRGATGITTGTKTNTLLGANITAGGNQAVFQDQSASVFVVPTGVTGTIINLDKRVSSSADATGNLAAAPVFDPSNAAILRDIAQNLVPTRSGFFRITLSLPAGAPTETGVSFTPDDDLPDGVIYDQLTNTGCGAATTNLVNAAGSGNAALQLSGATLNAGTDCVITFRARSSTAGVYPNTIASYQVRSSSGTANLIGDGATLTVRDGIQIAKSFAPSQVGPGGRTRLSIDLTNNDPTRAIDITGLTDDLAAFVAPGNLVVSSPAQVSTTCRTATSAVPTIGAGQNIDTTGNIVSISGIRLPAAGAGSTPAPFTCSVSLSVESPVANGQVDQTNTIPTSNVTTTQGVTNNTPAAATLTVSPAAIGIDKIFLTSDIDPGQTTRLRVTLTNNNAYVLSGVSFTDFFTRDGVPFGACTTLGSSSAPECPLRVEIANPPNATTTCSANVPTFNADGTVTNTAATPVVNAVGVSQGLATNANRQFGLTGGAIAANSTCVVEVDVTGYIAGANVNKIPINVVTTDQRATNTVGAAGISTQSSVVIFTTFRMEKSFTPTTVVAGTGVSRLRLVLRNAYPSALTALNITDNFTSDGTATGTPTGMKIAPVPTTPTNTCGGSIAAFANATSWSLSGGNLASGGFCTIEVDVVANRVGTSTAPTFLNQIPRTNAEADSGGTVINPRNGTQATLNTNFIPPTVAKSYNPTRIEPNATSQLTITLSNYATAGIATLSAPFTDSVSSSLQITGVASSVGCNAASLSTTATSFTYATGGTIPAAVGATPGTCTIVLNVRGATTTTVGSFPNTIPADALKTDRGSNPAPANATLNITPPLVGYKYVVRTVDADNSQTTTVGDTLNWVIYYKHEGTANITGVDITDTLSSNMTVAGTPTISRLVPPATTFTTATTTGMNAGFAGTGSVLSSPLATVVPNEVIRIVIPVTITGGVGTNLTNQATATVAAYSSLTTLTDNADTTTTVPANIGVGLPTGTTIPQTALAGQNLTLAPVVATPTAAGWKFVEISNDADLSQSVTQNDTILWTIFYKNTGTVALTNVVIADTFPAGLTVGQAQITRAIPPTAFPAATNTNLPTTAIASIAPGEVIRVTVPTLVTATPPVTLDNQATLTAGNLPIAGVKTDNSITGPAPTGVTPPTAAINQPNTTGGLDPTQVSVIVPVTVSGRVYNDVASSGVRGTNPGIQGVAITILVTPPTGAPFTRNLITDTNGDYSAIIPSGSSVQITETQPGAYGNAAQNPSNVINLTNVTTNQTLQDFGERTGAISGQVFQDNGLSNGVFLVGTDTPLANQCITLTGTDFGLDGVAGGTGLNADTAVTFSTRTDVNGNYSFASGATNVFPSVDCTGTAITAFAGLKRGSYSVEERIQPTGTADGITTSGAATTGGTAGTTTPLGTTPDIINNLVLGAGQTSSGNNFAEVVLSSIAGVVFQTSNNDNIQQAGEPGIAGVTVTLTGTNDLGQVVTITTTTASAVVAAGGTVTNNVSINGGAATPVSVTVPAGLPVGGYYFGALRPATYTITETQPANFISTVTNTAVGTIGGTPTGTAANNVISAVVLGSNQNSIANNFAELPPATLAGRVFRTVVDDNTFDAGDVGLGGQTITLAGRDDLNRDIVITTTTASAAVAGGGTVTNNVSINGAPAVPVTITVPAGGVPVGGYFFGQLPKSSLAGYTVTETTQPTLHSSTVTNTRAGNPTNGTPANDATSSVIANFGDNLVNYDFGELQSDLSITKSLDVATPTIGQNVVFTITVTNNGFSNNTGISVRDFLPSGYTFISSTPAVGSGVTRTAVTGGDQLDWTVGNLTASGASSTATLLVRATVNATATLANTNNFVQVQNAAVADPDSTPGDNTTNTNTAADDDANAVPTQIKAAPSISGFVYLDVNNNTTRGIGENGLGNPNTNPAPTPVPTITLTGTDINGNPVNRTATPDSSTGAWSITDLLPPATGTTYTLTQDQPTNYSNGSTNVGTGATVNGTANSATNTITRIDLQGNENGINFNFGELLADLTIAKAQVGGTTIQAGQLGVQFQIITVNNGPTQATGVVVRDFLPSGYSYVSSTIGGGAATPTITAVAGGTQLEWNVGTLNNNQSNLIIVTVNVDANSANVTPATTRNFVQIQASNMLDPDSTPGDNTTNIDTAADDDSESSPTISGLNTLAGRSYLDVNDSGVFDAGTDLPLSGVQVILTGTDINGAVTQQSAFTSGTGEYVFTNLLDTPGTVGSPTSTGYTVTQLQPATTNRSTTVGDSAGTASSTGNPALLTVPPGTSVGGQVTNIQLIDTVSINRTEINFGELRADLSLSKTIINPLPPIQPLVGSNVTFRLAVQNSGETRATGIVVQDVLPAGYSFVSSSNASATNAAGTITWNVGALNAGAASSVDIVAQVEANKTVAEYTNAAQITASDVLDPDSQPNNGTTNGQDDTSSVVTTPIPVADLQITKTDGITAPATINAGAVNTYTIVVTNAGPSNVIGAGVTDTLPNAFYAATGRQWRCVQAAAAGGATCPAGTTGFQTGDLATNADLAANSSLTFEVRGTLLNPINGTISNTATVAVPAGVVDPTPSNNDATDTTPIAPGDVIGVVFVDTNGNGSQDPGELGIPNIDVVLTDVNGVTRTVQTNATGNYTFLNIPAGAATVDVITTDPDFPAQHVQTAGTDPSPVNVVSGGTVAGANPADAGFDGYQPRGDVNGVVFIDTNGNGSQDPGEVGIPNITVTLTDPFGGTKTTTTGANGTYSFTGVPAGISTVDVDTTDPDFPANHVQTAGTDPSPVTVVFGQNNNAGFDGYQPRGDVVGIIFYDTNGNGALDSGEPRLGGVDVKITDAFGGIRTVTTNASGEYTALSVPASATPATVDVVESTLPAGVSQTAGTDPSPVVVQVGKTVANANPNDAGIDGYRRQGTVTGVVFTDTNGDGIQNPGEPGIPNVDVQITDAGGKVTTVTTGSDGKYTAPGVLEGTAIVNVVDATLPPNLTQTAGLDSSPVNVVANTTNDAGFDGYRPQGSVFGRVFLDPNGNKIQDLGEPGINNVTVQITDSAGKVVTTTTNASGDWSVLGVLSGNATVKVIDSTLPVGVVLTTTGSDPNVVNVLPNIANDAGKDGYQQRGTLTGHVWRDDNNDGIQQPTEPNFPNVLVTITDLGGTPVQVRTDANGNYTADVAAGPVNVVYTTPDNHRLTTANSTQTVNVPPAGNAKAADVGYQPLFGGLTGRVFYDTNNNGVQDPGEPGIAGVRVEITDAKGNLKVVTTDANGDYATGDRDLAFGSATVKVIDPTGHVLTTNNNPQVVQVPAGAIGRVPNVGYVRPSIRLEKNVVVGDQVIPRDQQPTVLVGGTLAYQLSVINNGVVVVSNVVITDTLPIGLQYQAGSSTAAGAVIADPTLSTNAEGKQVLVWTLPGSIAANASRSIRFKTIVTPAANNGNLLNVASATATAANGTTTVGVQSNASIAAVKVSLGVFNPRTTIVGRVYFDNNNNDSFERDTDEAVQGARVYLSDGRWAVTDTLGRYSIPDVEPGRHAVRLDPFTAPFTCKYVPDDAPCTRFVVAPETGGITIEDFLLNPPTGAAVKSRSTLVQRGPVTLTKAIAQGGAGYAVTITITLEKAVQNLVITDPLPTGTVERGVPQISNKQPFTFDGTTLRLTGVVPAGTYTITYPLFTPLPPDLVLTDPDISYEEIFTLIQLPVPNSDEVIR